MGDDKKLIPFKDNYADNSTEAGFQFTFFCEICNEGFKSRFVESKTYKKKSLFNNIGRMASVVGSFTGNYGLSDTLGRGSDVISERFNNMSPEWQKEHEKAFESAQKEAVEHFVRCPKCAKWVCPHCFNDQAGLCSECAPRENIEIAAAKAEVTKEQIWQKAQNTELFKGDIETKVTVCPKCGKPAGEGKFCGECGASLKTNVCPKCGAENNPSSKFCAECGNKF